MLLTRSLPCRLEELGQGEFGVVRHALFSCPGEPVMGEQTAGLGQYRDVAVKTLKTKADITSEQEFLAEIV